MDCILPGSSVHGIFQTRVLEWVAIAFSRGSSQTRDQAQVSCTAGRRFTLWATGEAQEGPCEIPRVTQAHCRMWRWAPTRPKNQHWGTSCPMVQWLGIPLPMQGTWVQSLAQEDSTCCRGTELLYHSCWPHALKPSSCNYWSSCTTEWPCCSPQLEKAKNK